MLCQSFSLCFLLSFYFRYLPYPNHGNECYVSHFLCVSYYHSISDIYLTIIMAMSAKSVMFSVFVIIILFQIFTLPKSWQWVLCQSFSLCFLLSFYFRYLPYHNHGNECHVSHFLCVSFYYFISGIYFTIIMAMSVRSVMFSVLVIILFQVFTLP